MLGMIWTHSFPISTHSYSIRWLGDKKKSKNGEEMGKLHWAKLFFENLYQLTSSYQLIPAYSILFPPPATNSMHVLK